MKYPELDVLTGRTGPFLTVSLDATRTDPSAPREIELRWKSLADRIPADWPAPVIEAARSLMVEPTGHRGPSGRFLVADRSGILLDLVLPERPPRDEVVIGPAPHLLPVLRAERDHPPHVVVQVDRTGADIDVRGLPSDEPEHEVVEGSHDELHKVSHGATSQRRLQARVEDSWERNAGEVARALEAVVRRHRPAVVLIAATSSPWPR